MKVTKKISFDEYWADPHYVAKRPIRNGSRVMMLGDNIYSRTNEDSPWHQEDSHHSFPDGSPNQSNIDKDTRSNAVLVSEHFVYYGKDAIEVPQEVLRVRIHSQNMTTAARAQAERKTFGHLP